MVYLLVFLVSSLGILLIFGARLLLRNRGARRLVRSLRKRFQSAEDRGARLVEETVIEKPRKNPRTSAIDLQKARKLLRSAERVLALQHYDQAEQLFIQTLTVQPDSIEARAQLAKLYLTTGRYAKAEALYKELLAMKEEISFFSNLGLAYYRQEKYVEACHAYQEALNRDPQTPERSAALGKACIAARRFSDAAPLLEKALVRLSRDTELMHMLAECYLQLNVKNQAEQMYRRIHKIEPYNEGVKQKLSALANA